MFLIDSQLGECSKYVSKILANLNHKVLLKKGSYRKKTKKQKECIQLYIYLTIS